jgi:hypothetical protein
MTCFWNCLFDFHTNIREIFTRSGNLLPGYMIKGKTVKCLIMTWTNGVWTLLQVEMHGWSDYPLWSSTETAYSSCIPSDPNLDYLTCCKTPYSITIRIKMEKRKGFATTDICWRTMSADTLQDLVCSCNGTSPCKKSCACFEENLACTDLCFCQGSEWCTNAQTHTLREDTSQITEQ